MKNKIRNSLRRPLAVGDRVIASDYAPEDMRGYKGVIQDVIHLIDDRIYWLVKFDHLEQPCEVHAAFLVREETPK